MDGYLFIAYFITLGLPSFLAGMFASHLIIVMSNRFRRFQLWESAHNMDYSIFYPKQQYQDHKIKQH